jgi:hypothetical protein
VTDVVVRLRADAAEALRRGAQDAGVTELKRLLTGFGSELRQQHPGVSDPQLQSYFNISVDSPDQADRIAAALRALDAVDAAYVQPPPTPA